MNVTRKYSENIDCHVEDCPYFINNHYIIGLSALIDLHAYSKRWSQGNTL